MNNILRNLFIKLQLSMALAWIAYTGTIYAVYSYSEINAIDTSFIYYFIIIAVSNIVIYYLFSTRLSIHTYTEENYMTDDQLIRLKQNSMFIYCVYVVFSVVSIIGSSRMKDYEKIYLMWYFITSAVYSTFALVSKITKDFIFWLFVDKHESIPTESTPVTSFTRL